MKYVQKITVSVFIAVFCFGAIPALAEKPAIIPPKINSDNRERLLDIKTMVKDDVRAIKIATTSTSTRPSNIASSTKRILENARENIKSIREEEKKKVEEKIDSLRAARIAEKNAKIFAYMKRTVERFNIALERLQTLADRIQSRLDKLISQGIDESSAKGKLQTAQGKIYDAKTQIGDLARFVATNSNQNQATSTTETLNDGFRQKVASALTALKEIQTALLDVISSVKTGPNTRATTTIDFKIKNSTSTRD